MKGTKSLFRKILMPVILAGIFSLSSCGSDMDKFQASQPRDPFGIDIAPPGHELYEIIATGDPLLEDSFGDVELHEFSQYVYDFMPELYDDMSMERRYILNMLLRSYYMMDPYRDTNPWWEWDPALIEQNILPGMMAHLKEIVRRINNQDMLDKAPEYGIDDGNPGTPYYPSYPEYPANPVDGSDPEGYYQDNFYDAMDVLSAADIDITGDLVEVMKKAMYYMNDTYGLGYDTYGLGWPTNYEMEAKINEMRTYMESIDGDGVDDEPGTSIASSLDLMGNAGAKMMLRGNDNLWVDGSGNIQAPGTGTDTGLGNAARGMEAFLSGVYEFINNEEDFGDSDGSDFLSAVNSNSESSAKVMKEFLCMLEDYQTENGANFAGYRNLDDDHNDKYYNAELRNFILEFFPVIQSMMINGDKIGSILQDQMDEFGPGELDFYPLEMMCDAINNNGGPGHKGLNLDIDNYNIAESVLTMLRNDANLRPRYGPDGLGRSLTRDDPWDSNPRYAEKWTMLEKLMWILGALDHFGFTAAASDSTWDTGNAEIASESPEGGYVRSNNNAYGPNDDGTFLLNSCGNKKGARPFDAGRGHGMHVPYITLWDGMGSLRTANNTAMGTIMAETMSQKPGLDYMVMEFDGIAGTLASDVYMNNMFAFLGPILPRLMYFDGTPPMEMNAFGLFGDRPPGDSTWMSPDQFSPADALDTSDVNPADGYPDGEKYHVDVHTNGPVLVLVGGQVVGDLGMPREGDDIYDPSKYDGIQGGQSYSPYQVAPYPETWIDDDGNGSIDRWARVWIPHCEDGMGLITTCQWMFGWLVRVGMMGQAPYYSMEDADEIDTSGNLSPGSGIWQIYAPDGTKYGVVDKRTTPWVYYKDYHMNESEKHRGVRFRHKWDTNNWMVKLTGIDKDGGDPPDRYYTFDQANYEIDDWNKINMDHGEPTKVNHGVGFNMFSEQQIHMVGSIPYFGLAAITENEYIGRGYNVPSVNDCTSILQPSLEYDLEEPKDHKTDTEYLVKVYGHAGGMHTSSDNQTVLTDNSKSWTTNEFADAVIYNKPDGSSCTVASNTANTVTCSGSLTGGTENLWDGYDSYVIVKAGDPVIAIDSRVNPGTLVAPSQIDAASPTPLGYIEYSGRVVVNGDLSGQGLEDYSIPPPFERSEIGCLADGTGIPWISPANIGDGRYWWLFTNTTSYYVWYHTGGGSDPNPSAPSGAPSATQGIEVLYENLDGASKIAAATAAAIGEQSDFEAVSDSSTVIVYHPTMGNYRDVQNGNMPGVSGFLWDNFDVTRQGSVLPTDLSVTYYRDPMGSTDEVNKKSKPVQVAELVGSKYMFRRGEKIDDPLTDQDCMNDPYCDEKYPYVWEPNPDFNHSVRECDSHEETIYRNLHWFMYEKKFVLAIPMGMKMQSHMDMYGDVMVDLVPLMMPGCNLDVDIPLVGNVRDIMAGFGDIGDIDLDGGAAMAMTAEGNGALGLLNLRRLEKGGESKGNGQWSLQQDNTDTPEVNEAYTYSNRPGDYRLTLQAGGGEIDFTFSMSANILGMMSMNMAASMGYNDIIDIGFAWLGMFEKYGGTMLPAIAIENLDVLYNLIYLIPGCKEKCLYGEGRNPYSPYEPNVYTAELLYTDSDKLGPGGEYWENRNHLMPAMMALFGAWRSKMTTRPIRDEKPVVGPWDFSGASLEFPRNCITFDTILKGMMPAMIKPVMYYQNNSGDIDDAPINMWKFALDEQDGPDTLYWIYDRDGNPDNGQQAGYQPNTHGYSGSSGDWDFYYAYGTYSAGSGTGHGSGSGSWWLASQADYPYDNDYDSLENDPTNEDNIDPYSVTGGEIDDPESFNGHDFNYSSNMRAHFVPAYYKTFIGMMAESPEVDDVGPEDENYLVSPVKTDIDGMVTMNTDLMKSGMRIMYKLGSADYDDDPGKYNPDDWRTWGARRKIFFGLEQMMSSMKVTQGDMVFNDNGAPGYGEIVNENEWADNLLFPPSLVNSNAGSLREEDIILADLLDEFIDDPDAPDVNGLAALPENRGDEDGDEDDWDNYYELFENMQELMTDGGLTGGAYNMADYLTNIVDELDEKAPDIEDQHFQALIHTMGVVIAVYNDSAGAWNYPGNITAITHLLPDLMEVFEQHNLPGDETMFTDGYFSVMKVMLGDLKYDMSLGEDEADWESNYKWDEGLLKEGGLVEYMMQNMSNSDPAEEYFPELEDFLFHLSYPDPFWYDVSSLMHDVLDKYEWKDTPTGGYDGNDL